MILVLNSARRVLACLCCCLAAGSTLTAQSDLYDAVVPPASATVKSLGDYLVQQAWINTPGRGELEAKVAVTDARIRVAERGWIDQINANLNISSQRDTLTFLGQSNIFNNQYLAPGINYGLSVNLGGLINNKRRTEVVRAERDVALAQLNGPKPELRLSVLLAVQEVENSRELLRIRRRGELDAETNYSLVRSLYDQGKAQFEDLAQASEVYFRAVESTAVAKANQVSAQTELESLTGLSPEQIDDARKRYAGK